MVKYVLYPTVLFTLKRHRFKAKNLQIVNLKGLALKVQNFKDEIDLRRFQSKRISDETKLSIGGSAFVEWVKLVQNHYEIKILISGRCQGCRIFLGPKYQNGEKYTKLPQNIPYGH
jgi:hypothetical protein